MLLVAWEGLTTGQAAEVDPSITATERSEALAVLAAMPERDREAPRTPVGVVAAAAGGAVSSWFAGGW